MVHTCINQKCPAYGAAVKITAERQCSTCGGPMKAMTQRSVDKMNPIGGIGVGKLDKTVWESMGY